MRATPTATELCGGAARLPSARADRARSAVRPARARAPRRAQRARASRSLVELTARPSSCCARRESAGELGARARQRLLGRVVLACHLVRVLRSARGAPAHPRPRARAASQRAQQIRVRAVRRLHAACVLSRCASAAASARARPRVAARAARRALRPQTAAARRPFRRCSRSIRRRALAAATDAQPLPPDPLTGARDPATGPSASAARRRSACANEGAVSTAASALEHRCRTPHVRRQRPCRQRRCLGAACDQRDAAGLEGAEGAGRGVELLDAHRFEVVPECGFDRALPAASTSSAAASRGRAASPAALSQPLALPGMIAQAPPPAAPRAK